MENRPRWGPGLGALSKWEWELFRSRNTEKMTQWWVVSVDPTGTLPVDRNHLNNLDTLKTSLEESGTYCGVLRPPMWRWIPKGKPCPWPCRAEGNLLGIFLSLGSNGHTTTVLYVIPGNLNLLPINHFRSWCVLWKALLKTAVQTKSTYSDENENRVILGSR